MSIDYGRLTAEDRREIRRAARLLRWDATIPNQVSDPRWKFISFDTWEWDARWGMDYGNEDRLGVIECGKAADILESLLMTDRMFR